MTRYNGYDALLQLQCVHCGEMYEAQRQNSQYCSSKCRVAAYRARAKRKKKLSQIGSDTSRRYISYKHSKKLDTIGGISRDTELILNRLYHDTNADIAERAIDICWQMLVDLRRIS